mmetsp:Transcript_6025/g.5187  ORF Transcript_6025/g.5187 Transcript_6025/m.5187 type:complete len:205 (+) Transcript_6025:132-746(+)
MKKSNLEHEKVETYLLKKSKMNRQAPLIVPPIFIGGCILSTGLFLYRASTYPYLSPEHTNSFSYYFGYQSHIMAVIAGSFIGAELLNFHEPEAAKFLSKGRRFFIPVILMGFSYYAMNKLDNLKAVGSFGMLLGCISLSSFALISRTELALPKWSATVLSIYCYPVIITCLLAYYMVSNREIYFGKQYSSLKGIVKKIKEKKNE